MFCHAESCKKTKIKLVLKSEDPLRILLKTALNNEHYGFVEEPNDKIHTLMTQFTL